MIIRVFYDAGSIWIDGRDDPIPCGTLVASQSGTVLSVQGIHSTGSVLVACDYANSKIADINGATLDTIGAALAYLAVQFELRPIIVTAKGIAATALKKGQPVAVLRSNGQLTAARADAYPLGFVVGLSTSDADTGFICTATRSPVSLDDWSQIAGAQSLVVGQPYFLGPSGGLTLQVPTAPQSACLARVGQATSPQTFLFLQSDPILL